MTTATSDSATKPCPRPGPTYEGATADVVEFCRGVLAERERADPEIDGDGEDGAARAAEVGGLARAELGAQRR